MPNFNLKEYATVQERITLFWEKYPEGRIITALASDPDDWKQCRYRAEVFANRDDTQPVATGYAFEIAGTGMANQTSHEENCETSAIGRALANLGFATSHKDRPSQEEMQKVQRMHEEIEAQQQEGVSAPRQPAPPRIRAVRSVPPKDDGAWSPPEKVENTAHLVAVLNKHYGWKIAPDAKLASILDHLHEEYGRNPQDIMPFDQSPDGKKTRYPSTVWAWVRERATPEQTALIGGDA